MRRFNFKSSFNLQWLKNLLLWWSQEGLKVVTCTKSLPMVSGVPFKTNLENGIIENYHFDYTIFVSNSSWLWKWCIYTDTETEFFGKSCFKMYLSFVQWGKNLYRGAHELFKKALQLRYVEKACTPDPTLPSTHEGLLWTFNR